MWTRKELKFQAKESITANYWKAVLAALILCCCLFPFVVSNPLIAFITLPAALVIWIFICNPLEVGDARFFLRNLSARAEVKELFFSFDNNYIETVKTLFLRNLFVLLWSLLFVVPGIYKMYEYRMIPYLFATDSSMTQRRAFAESKRLMDGQKWNAFVLDLSFIGWHFVSFITFEIVGVFYVAPYQAQTNAALFEKLKFATSWDSEPSPDGPVNNDINPSLSFSPHVSQCQSEAYMPYVTGNAPASHEPHHPMPAPHEPHHPMHEPPASHEPHHPAPPAPPAPPHHSVPPYAEEAPHPPHHPAPPAPPEPPAPPAPPAPPEPPHYHMPPEPPVPPMPPHHPVPPAPPAPPHHMPAPPEPPAPPHHPVPPAPPAPHEAPAPPEPHEAPVPPAPPEPPVPHEPHHMPAPPEPPEPHEPHHMPAPPEPPEAAEKHTENADSDLAEPLHAPLDAARETAKSDSANTNTPKPDLANKPDSADVEEKNEEVGSWIVSLKKALED